jgi:hypothetical protein
VKRMNKLRKKTKVVITLLVIGLALTACSGFPFGTSGGSPAPLDVQAEITFTDTQAPTPIDTATITTTPTETIIPSPTLSPTTRPTWTPFPTKTLRPTWTPSPTLSPTPTKEIGWIIKDDFSDVTDGWLQKEGGNWAIGYARGGYFMSVNGNNVEITSSKSWLKLDDVRVILDVYRQHGKGYWGISCRETVAGSYYTIFVTSDGEYGYGETRNEKVYLTLLGESKEILLGLREVNHVVAECRGNLLKLFVNDTMLFQHEVEGIGPGWVGMMAGTMYDQETVTVIFDNIEIWGPLVDETGE